MVNDRNEDSSPNVDPGLIGLREQVDAIDDQLMELMVKRIELASEIMKAKPAGQIVDSSREQAIVKRYHEKLADLSTLAKTKRLVSAIIQASKCYPDV